MNATASAVLKIHVRHRAVVDDSCAIFGQSRHDSFDIVYGESMLAAKSEERIERRLDRITNGENLYGGLGNEESRAQTGHHLFGPWLARKRLQRVVLAVENVGHTCKTGLRHNGRGDAITRAHAGKIESLLHMFRSRSQLQIPDTCCAAYDSA